MGLKFFDTRNFLKHIRVSLRFHLVLWDETIFTETGYTRHLFYSEKLPKMQKLIETQNRSPMIFFDTVKQQIFFKKSCFSPVGQNTSRYPKLTDTQKGLLRIDPVLWDKTFLTENHDTSPLFYPLHFFISENLRITESFQLRSFSVLWDNKFSIKNRDIPLLGMNFFNTRNILIHSRVFYEVIRCCEAKQFGREHMMPAHSFNPNIFRYQKICKSQKVSTFEVFWYCETTNFS